MDESPKKQFLIGAILIGSVALFITLLWIGSYLPGFPGELCTQVSGMFWSPVILELSLFFIGCLLLTFINGMRKNREGPDYVSIEFPDETEKEDPSQKSL